MVCHAGFFFFCCEFSVLRRHLPNG
jgi:hypothetical protein